jgi:hypothetical protein
MKTTECKRVVRDAKLDVAGWGLCKVQNDVNELKVTMLMELSSRNMRKQEI